MNHRRLQPLLLPLAFFLFLTLLPSLLPASESGESLDMKKVLWDMGIKVLDVAIIAFFAFKFLSKPLSRLVETRADSIKRAHEEAAAARRESKATLQAFHEKVKQIDSEFEALRKQSIQEVDKEQHLLLEEARRASEHVRQHARDTIRQEVAKAREELHQEVVHLSTELAEELVTKNITSQDQKRMIHDYLSEMEASK